MDVSGELGIAGQIRELARTFFLVESKGSLVVVETEKLCFCLDPLVLVSIQIF